MANRKKNISISFRTTEEESAKIHVLADTAGLSLSEYLTEAALLRLILQLV